MCRRDCDGWDASAGQRRQLLSQVRLEVREATDDDVGRRDVVTVRCVDAGEIDVAAAEAKAREPLGERSGQL